MSTIKVDTYLTRGGASEIAIDKLKGVSSASSISVVAEGGTNTTNLQQGLAKSWSKHDNTGTISITDSFNLTSISDEGTGIADFTLTNSFSNANYSIVATCSDTSGHMQIVDHVQATGSYRYRTLNSSFDLVDDPSVYGNTHGDLA